MNNNDKTKEGGSGEGEYVSLGWWAFEDEITVVLIIEREQIQNRELLTISEIHLTVAWQTKDSEFPPHYSKRKNSIQELTLSPRVA